MTRHLLTALVVLAAAAAVGWKYLDYLRNPWTRDAHVRANVIQVAPRVSGPIISLPIIDNQAVKAGDLLFEIDPRTYQAALAKAKAELDRTIDDISALEQQVKVAEASVKQYDSAITEAQTQVVAAESTLEESARNLERVRVLLEKGDIAQARFDRVERDVEVDRAEKRRAEAALLSAESAKQQAEATLAQALANLGAPGEDNARLRSARASVESAELDLEFTRVTASVDGFVTNLKLRLGSQAVAETPALALVDAASYWIDAYFRETLTSSISPGDEAVITLMSDPELPLLGTVDSLGWGIAQEDGSTGEDLLPTVSPTFEWVRLAQRIPVRVVLKDIPDGVALRIGATASVLVRTDGRAGPAVAAPTALQ